MNSENSERDWRECGFGDDISKKGIRLCLRESVKVGV